MGWLTFSKATQGVRPGMVILGQFDLPEIAQDGVPPTEFRLFPWGKHTSEKGDFIFDAQSAKSVLAAFERKGHDMPIDYEHNMVKPAASTPGDGPTPAAGWITKLEARGDPKKPDDAGGLWATGVKWAKRGAEYLSGREYRHYSPAFLYEPKTTRITELINVALTNTPAQHHQAPLVAAKDDKEHPMEPKALLAMLKLSPDASEADALVAVQAIRSERDTAQVELKQLVELTGKTSAAEAKGVLTAWKSAAETAAVLQGQLAEAKKAKRAAVVERLIKQGMKDRKISPAMKPLLEKQASEKGGVKFLKAFLEQAPALVGVTGPKEKKAGKAKASLKAALAELTADEKKIATESGVSLEDYAKSKLAHQKAAAAGSEG